METSDFADEIKKEELNQKKCFCCGQRFYVENGHDICICESTTNSDNCDEDVVEDLSLLMCAKCFQRLLEENGYQSCEKCGTLSNNLESHMTFRGSHEEPPEYSDDVCLKCQN